MLIDIGIVNQSTREFSRKSYTLRHKRLMVHGVENRVASGMSIKEACALERVERRVFCRWKKTSSLLKDKDDVAGETRETEQVKKLTMDIAAAHIWASLLMLALINQLKTQWQSTGRTGWIQREWGKAGR